MDDLEKLVFESKTLRPDSIARFIALLQERQQTLLPKLTKLDFRSAFTNPEDSGQFFTAVGKASAFPSLKELDIKLSQEPGHHAFAGGFSEALSRGSFPDLESLDLWEVKIGDAGFADVCKGLEGSACAKSLKRIRLRDCDISLLRMNAFWKLVSKDCLPALSLSDAEQNHTVGGKDVCKGLIDPIYFLQSCGSFSFY
jgi:hypothetical protein